MWYVLHQKNRNLLFAFKTFFQETKIFLPYRFFALSNLFFNEKSENYEGLINNKTNIFVWNQRCFSKNAVIKQLECTEQHWNYKYYTNILIFKLKVYRFSQFLCHCLRLFWSYFLYPKSVVVEQMKRILDEDIWFDSWVFLLEVRHAFLFVGLRETFGQHNQ